MKGNRLDMGSLTLMQLLNGGRQTRQKSENKWTGGCSDGRKCKWRADAPKHLKTDDIFSTVDCSTEKDVNVKKKYIN